MSLELLLAVPVIPPEIRQYSNGKLPRELLVDIDDGMTLHYYAAPAWRALQWYVFNTFGWHLGATEGYRGLDSQTNIFYSRYTTDPSQAAKTVSGRYVDVKRVGGVNYYLRPGQATAAAPGTSNHGWGLGVDTCEMVADGDAVRRISLSEARAADLLLCVTQFGFAWEIQSERWHLIYINGWPWPVTQEPPQQGPEVPQPQEREVYTILHPNPRPYAPTLTYDFTRLPAGALVLMRRQYAQQPMTHTKIWLDGQLQPDNGQELRYLPEDGLPIAFSMPSAGFVAVEFYLDGAPRPVPAGLPMEVQVSPVVEAHIF